MPEKIIIYISQITYVYRTVQFQSSPVQSGQDPAGISSSPLPSCCFSSFFQSCRIVSYRIVPYRTVSYQTKSSGDIPRQPQKKRLRRKLQRPDAHLLDPALPDGAVVQHVAGERIVHLFPTWLVDCKAKQSE